MENYYQAYELNKTSEATVAANAQLSLGNLPLTAAGTVALTLRGVIGTLESGGQTGIGGASVTVYAPDGTAVAQTTTAATDPQTGAFTLNFNGTQNVYYTVTATAPGYTPATNSVTFNGGLSTTVVLLLSPDTAIYAFYGTVADSATGQGLGGVNINITDGALVNVNVTTAADGSFLAYDNFIPGTSYTLTAGKLGYTGQSTTAVLQVAPGTRVDFALAEGADNYTSLLGRVVIAGSDPIAPIGQALVGLYVVREGSVPVDNLIATTLTDAYGNYTFTALTPANTYVVRAIKLLQTSS